MSVLARVNWVAQQRVDLHHVLMQESFTAFDFRSMVTQLVGTDKQYVGRGFRVIGRTGLTVQIEVANSQVFNPADNNGSFYVGLSTDTPIAVDLPANQANVYVEGRFTNVTQAPVDTAFWDPLALTGADVSGTEFSASTNSQSIIVLVITANTIGFSPGAIPIMYAQTGASSINNMQDRRPLLYRLGTGGATPDPSHKYPWSNIRQEPVPNGVGVGDAVDSPWRSRDAVGSINDKAFGSFKEWADAVMTQISDITGSSLWYVNAIANAPVANVSLNEVFFDTLGSNLQAIGHSSAFKWKKVGGNLCLCGEGNVAQTGTTPSAHEGLIRWQSNYSKLEWQLGATFTSATFRNYSEVKFQAPAPDLKGNTYLLLEREVPKGSGAAVNWGSNVANGSFIATKSISGQAGDFTGIALGDFVRKLSEGYARYYRVARMSDGITIYSSLTVDDQNRVADAAITILELEDTIASGASLEPMRYFRARYSNADLFSDQNISTNGYQYQDANYWWLGRRYGNLFYLRDFGYMQENDEVDAGRPEVDGINIGGTGNGDLQVQHGKQARYILSTGNYELAPAGSGNLLTIYRRSRDNTVATPGPSDNSGSILTYTIAPTVVIPNVVGNTLWARLSNTTSGALALGTVVSPTDDLDNTDVVNNVYQVLTAAQTPLRTGDNQDIYPICRVESDGAGRTFLIFFDGSVLSEEGVFFNNNVEVSGDMRIRGNLVVNGASIVTETEIVQIDDKLIDLGVGNLNTGSGGSGIQIADNTQQTTSATSVAGVAGTGYIDLTVPLHGFTFSAGQLIGVSSNVMVGGVDGGTISNDYVNIAFPGAGAIGKVQIVNANTLRIFPNSVVFSSETVVPVPPTTQIRIFDLLSWIKLSDADGLGSGLTSWAFKVKPSTQVVTLTPVTSYGTVPTAHSVNMASNRIPFVNNDNSGPGGNDSTLNFSASLTWDGTNLNVDGNIIPLTDNTWDLGSTAFRWKTLHVGPGSVVVHNDNTNTAWSRLDFSSGVARLITDTVTYLQVATGANADVSGSSGWLSLNTGTGLGSGGQSGQLSVFTGDGDLASGALLIYTGAGTAITGNINITVGTATDSGSVGGDLNLASGSSSDTVLGSGGSVSIDGGSGANGGSLFFNAASGNITGGQVQLNAGAGAAGNGGTWAASAGNSGGGFLGGDMNLSAGTSTDAGGTGGNITMLAGAADNFGGNVTIAAGTATSILGGSLLFSAGSAPAIGGGVQISSGAASGAGGTGGYLILQAGASNDPAGGFGGSVTLQAGDCAGVGQPGGDVSITAGNGTGVASDGGSVIITAGSATVGGTPGIVQIVGQALWLNGSALRLNYSATKTANYTATLNDCVIPINTTGGAFTVTLPPSTANNKGQMIVVKDVGGFIVFVGKALTIAPNGTDTIDGFNVSVVTNFAQYTSLSFVSNGAGGWIII